MTPAFITLPSGLRVNTAHIFYFRVNPDKKESIQIAMTKGEKWLEEDMTVAELDALLQPQGTPIVEAVVNLDRIYEGAGCSFSYEGVNRHGIIQEIHSGGLEPNIFVLSGGERFQVMPKSRVVVNLGVPTPSPFQ